MKKAVQTDKAPKAVGAYSQAVVTEGNVYNSEKTIYCAGQIPLDPATGKLVEGDIYEQTKRVLENLKAVLEEGGFSFEDVVRCEVFLDDLNNFVAVNEVYSEYFTGENKPARITIQVAKLPLNSPVEIACIACKN